MKETINQIVAEIKTWLFTLIIFSLVYLSVYEIGAYITEISAAHLSLLGLPRIAGLLLASVFAIALSMPAWDGWKTWIIVPLPISGAIYLNLVTFEPLNALIGSLVIFALMAHHTKRSADLKRELIRVRPYFILRPAIKGFLIGISMAAAFIFLLTPVNQNLNIGGTIAEALSAPVRQLLVGDGEEQNLGETGRQAPQMEIALFERTIEAEIEEQVKRAIEPYRQVINVFTSVAVYIGMHGLTVAVYAIYSLLVGPIYWIAGKMGLIHFSKEIVEREYVHF